MSSTTSSTTVATSRRPNLINSLFPSVISGIILGVAGAAGAGVLVNRMTTVFRPKGLPNDDAGAAAVYTGLGLFFFLGSCALHGIFKRAFARPVATPPPLA